jgi:hypothetical protein
MNGLQLLGIRSLACRIPVVQERVGWGLSLHVHQDETHMAQKFKYEALGQEIAIDPVTLE